MKELINNYIKLCKTMCRVKLDPGSGATHSTNEGESTLDRSGSCLPSAYSNRNSTTTVC